MSQFAQWLDHALYDFDHLFLSFFHWLYEVGDGFFTPFFSFITFFCNGGWSMLAMGAILLVFPKTRKAGFAVLLAVAFGGLITNQTIKPLVLRYRPFQTWEEYRLWWEAVGGLEVGEFSFPSGHTTSAMAGITALVISHRKKWMPLSFIFVVLMGMSRNYLMVHYPTDIIGGVISGGVAAILAVIATHYIWIGVPKLYQKIKTKKA